MLYSAKKMTSDQLYSSSWKNYNWSADEDRVKIVVVVVVTKHRTDFSVFLRCLVKPKMSDVQPINLSMYVSVAKFELTLMKLLNRN